MEQSQKCQRSLGILDPGSPNPKFIFGHFLVVLKLKRAKRTRIHGRDSNHNSVPLGLTMYQPYHKNLGLELELYQICQRAHRQYSVSSSQGLRIRKMEEFLTRLQEFHLEGNQGSAYLSLLYHAHQLPRYLECSSSLHYLLFLSCHAGGARLSPELRVTSRIISARAPTAQPRYRILVSYGSFHVKFDINPFRVFSNSAWMLHHVSIPIMPFSSILSLWRFKSMESRLHVTGGHSSQHTI